MTAVGPSEVLPHFCSSFVNVEVGLPQPLGRDGYTTLASGGGQFPRKLDPSHCETAYWSGSQAMRHSGKVDGGPPTETLVELSLPPNTSHAPPSRTESPHATYVRLTPHSARLPSGTLAGSRLAGQWQAGRGPASTREESGFALDASGGGDVDASWADVEISDLAEQHARNSKQEGSTRSMKRT